MKLTEISVENFRSIEKIDNAIFESLQSIIGENNAGKSTILNVIDLFLSAGASGITEKDFNDKSKKIIIKIKFKIESDKFKKIWKPYMANGELELEKHIWLEEDSKTGKITSKNEFHGYKAEPKDWFLSVDKIQLKKGAKPNWKEIVTENKLPDYFLNNGNCNKSDFSKGLDTYFVENDVEYDIPDLSKTQALGFQSKTISNLPRFYLLRAETTYTDETDKRSSSSTFRKLMADLTDRVIKNDPKYVKIEEALKIVGELLNERTVESAHQEERLESLSVIEKSIHSLLVNLIPSVQKVKLRVLTDDVTTIFSKGVELVVDDGVETEVLLKGHGLQRCIIFSLLQALILNERNQLIKITDIEQVQHPIILAIEEPELYIHPQIGKLFYDVLNLFSKKDQVIYTTHSPRFIDVFSYNSIALVKKEKVGGTQFINCDPKAFTGLTDIKIFQGLTQLNSDVNELFFAKKVIVVEGSEDKIAIIESLKKSKLINIRTEELDVTIVVAGGKQAIPFFMRVLNAFKIQYVVLYDLDIEEGMNPDDKACHEKRNAAILDLAHENYVTFPIKLERTLGLDKDKHLKDQYSALEYFSHNENITSDLEGIVNEVLKKIDVAI